jgi:hypothetical protein
MPVLADKCYMLLDLAYLDILLLYMVNFLWHQNLLHMFLHSLVYMHFLLDWLENILVYNFHMVKLILCLGCMFLQYIVYNSWLQISCRNFLVYTLDIVKVQQIYLLLQDDMLLAWSYLDIHSMYLQDTVDILLALVNCYMYHLHI